MMSDVRYLCEGLEVGGEAEHSCNRGGAVWLHRGAGNSVLRWRRGALLLGGGEGRGVRVQLLLALAGWTVDEFNDLRVLLMSLWRS